MTTYQVGYFVGSLSSTSINRLLAKAMARLAPPELVLSEIPIRDLPPVRYYVISRLDRGQRVDELKRLLR